MKLVKLLSAALLVSGVAFAVGPRLDDSIRQLNDEADRVVKPFVNDKTKAKITFVKIVTNADRVLEARGTASYSKVGNKNSFTATVSDLSYVYGNGSAPTTKFKANAAIDLTKSMTQDQINEIAPQLVAMVESSAKENLKEFGNAVTVVAKVTEEKKDAKGNYLAMKGEVTGSVDMSKLPAGKTPADVSVTKSTIKIAVNVKTGIDIDSVTLSNPSYKGYAPNSPESLKVLLEKFLGRDPAISKKIDDAVRFVDDFANSLVNN